MIKKFNFGKIDFYGCGSRRNEVIVEVEYSEQDGKKVFSACGEIWNSRHTDIVCGGQCLDTIANFINNTQFLEIYGLWNKYHLNDMHPECEHQAKLGWIEKAREPIVRANGEHTTLGWLRESEHPDGILGKACPVCGYKYGTQWLYRAIPYIDEQRIIKLLGQEAV